MNFICGPSTCEPCSCSNRVTDTVQFDASLVEATLLAEPTSEDPLKLNKQQLREEQDEAERVHLEEQQRAAEEHRPAEEAQCLEEMQQAEQQRLEEQRRLSEEKQKAAQHAEEESQRAVAARRLEAEVALSAEAKKQAAAQDEVESELAKVIVHEFLAAAGFKSLAVPRRRCCSSSYALHAAVEQNDAEVVTALLRCGADPARKNFAGKTPRDLAERLHGKKGQHKAVIQALGAPWF